MNKRELIEQYIDGWRKNDRDKILKVLSPKVVIIESHGPRYTGIKKVGEWVDSWIKGGVVNKWEVTSFYEAGDAAFLEWVFDCVSNKIHYNIEGISIIKFEGDKISYIREYMTSKPIFDWQK